MSINSINNKSALIACLILAASTLCGRSQYIKIRTEVFNGSTTNAQVIIIPRNLVVGSVLSVASNAPKTSRASTNSATMVTDWIKASITKAHNEVLLNKAKAVILTNRVSDVEQ